VVAELVESFVEVEDHQDNNILVEVVVDLADVMVVELVLDLLVEVEL
jgi:hypothetical protein